MVVLGDLGGESLDPSLLDELDPTQLRQVLHHLESEPAAGARFTVWLPCEGREAQHG